MDVTVTLTGHAELQNQLKAVAERAPDVMLQCLVEEAELEMTEMKLRTPVDTGALRSSGHIANPRRTGSEEFQVDIAFGGPAASYAVVVHEDLDAFHKVGQAKFVESVVLESAPHLPERLLRRVMERL
jgi:Bacteriophage HK97-gp10, putative tail-component